MGQGSPNNNADSKERPTQIEAETRLVLVSRSRSTHLRHHLPAQPLPVHLVADLARAHRRAVIPSARVRREVVAKEAR